MTVFYSFYIVDSSGALGRSFRIATQKVREFLTNKNEENGKLENKNRKKYQFSQSDKVHI